MRRLLLVTIVNLLLCFFSTVHAQDTIKVGVMYSLTGTMAISEAPLKDELLMLIEEQNRKGGLLGKKIEPVVVDPASDWMAFSELSRQLLTENKVAAVFGCWASVSRKAVLPIFEKYNGLLFYPVQFEGEEASYNIIYTGSTPEQQIIPAIDFLKDKRGITRWYLLGSDYVFPRTANKIIETYLEHKGVKKENIIVRYTQLGHSDWGAIVREIKAFGLQGQNTAVVSTLNGDANILFFNEMDEYRISPYDIPVMSFSVGEGELQYVDRNRLTAGNLASWGYFQSVDTKENLEFVRAFSEFTRNPKAVTNDPMESQYIAFSLWVKAVEKAGTTDVDSVLSTIVGLETANLSGGKVKVLPNHHLSKPAMIGQYQKDGQFSVIWRSQDNIPSKAFSEYLSDGKIYIADWVTLKCSKYDTVEKICLDRSHQNRKSEDTLVIRQD
ncbi:MAG: ABC transporter substrate-binding protein [Succinivibrio sp.]|nr:ABC transporter substrate-binding protein [Succinivibrio sp.]